MISNARRQDTSFGILTLASPNDYLKAIGLALSLRASNPGVPTAVACSKKVQLKLAPYFDHLIDEDPTVRGFAHKVHLDRYSPFESTFFFDSDVFVFKDVQRYAEQWGKPSYTAVGSYRSNGVSTFGLDIASVLKKIGFDKLVVIDGAGHAFFKKPECFEVFDLAREITANYRNYAGDIAFADEDAMAITMTMLRLEPAPYGDFFSRYVSALPRTLTLEPSKAVCHFIWRNTNERFDPCMMHFAANEAPFAYTRALYKLYRFYNVSTDGLFRLGSSDFWTTHIKWPLSSYVRGLRRRLSGG